MLQPVNTIEGGFKKNRGRLRARPHHQTPGSPSADKSLLVPVTQNAFMTFMAVLIRGYETCLFLAVYDGSRFESAYCFSLIPFFSVSKTSSSSSSSSSAQKHRRPTRNISKCCDHLRKPVLNVQGRVCAGVSLLLGSQTFIPMAPDPVRRLPYPPPHP